MLLLLFRVAEEWYAVDAGRVHEVVPRVALRAVPHAPRHLSGLFDYRGRVVPVVDLGVLLGAEPCQTRLSTRILVVDIGENGHTSGALLGLIAEQVSDVRAIPDGPSAFPPTSLEQAPYLGAIVRVDDGLVQLIEADRILTGALRDALVLTQAREP